MAVSREKPSQKPSIPRMLMAPNICQAEKDNINLVAKAFRDGLLPGRIVVQWCEKCRRWKTHHVAHGRNVTYGESFPCNKCKAKLLLVVDDFHTVLPNGDDP